eukprot:TRINITY_DN60855_c0_g1_i1.p1 TRINITY_DN60855_c0_g1~~TRINITY_DN60855_c0_g1_i1.p1  ORF type:complete len:1341 (+),score=194.59 TRINITY_DN60855_c0_g1_i1:197-4024(+)
MVVLATLTLLPGLAACASFGDPVSANVLSESLRFSSRFPAQKVLEDDGDEHGWIWLAADNTEGWFILDIGEVRGDITGFAIRNTRNMDYRDRGTLGYVIEASLDASVWSEVAKGELPYTLDLVQTASQESSMRYVRFSARTWVINGAGLGYFAVLAQAVPGFPASATIDSEGPRLADAFAAHKVLTDDGDEDGNIWLTPQQSVGWFVLDLGAVRSLTGFALRNTRRLGHWTSDYRIEVSPDKDEEAASWALAATGSLRELVDLVRVVTLVNTARYVKFVMLAHGGRIGGGLGFFAALVQAPRVYVYPLQECSFDHFDVREYGDPDRGPLPLQIHRHLLKGLLDNYWTSDAGEADLFYVPAPFTLWDNSPEAEADYPVLLRDAGVRRLGKNGIPDWDLFLGAKSVTGRDPRTISLWIRFEQNVSCEHCIVIATGPDRAGAAYDVSVIDGCLAVTSCGAEGEPPPSSCSGMKRLDDGRWHHVASTYDGNTSVLFVDGHAVGSRAASYETGVSVVSFGRQIGVCGVHEVFRGEVRNVQILGAALSEMSVRYYGGAASPESECFKAVRASVEATPWLRRRSGWDHFVLFGPSDYPLDFKGRNFSFVLEHAWPAFANFMVLHVGAITDRCAGGSPQTPTMDSMCRHRLWRTVNIPPFLAGEEFNCHEMREFSVAERPLRFSYRGLAVYGMPERLIMEQAAKTQFSWTFHKTGQIRLEFTNWTHERIARGGCKKSEAFAGFCPWKAVSRGMLNRFAVKRAQGMKRRSLELSRKAEYCLDMPGDGGYSLRTFSAINSGCIPVIVYMSGVNLPKVPFPNFLPWHKFAIFWDLSREPFVNDPPSHAALRDIRMNGPFGNSSVHVASLLLDQLMGMHPNVTVRKRKALMEHGPKLSWRPHEGCGKDGGRQATAVDLVVQDMSQRSRPLGDMPNEDLWRWKFPLDSINRSFTEDVSGTGCPSGFPICIPSEEKGDICYPIKEKSWACPLQCKRVDGGEGPSCVKNSDGGACFTTLCRTKLPDIVEAENFDVKQLKLVIVSWSEKPWLRDLTRKSLIRFCAAHPGVYHLMLEDEALLDERDYHPSWNKFAFIRRLILIDQYDYVIWIDGSVLITLPQADPIHRALTESFSKSKALFVVGQSAQELLTSPKERPRLDLGVIITKSSRQVYDVFNALFRIGHRLPRRPSDPDGTKRILQPDSVMDSLDVYVRRYGWSVFSEVGHGMLSSLFGFPFPRFWWPGHFAMQLAGNLSAPIVKHTVLRLTRNASQPSQKLENGPVYDMWYAEVT